MCPNVPFDQSASLGPQQVITRPHHLEPLVQVLHFVNFSLKCLEIINKSELNLCTCFWVYVSHPYPARKPRLGGLTLSLNMTTGRTWHEWAQPAMAISHHSWLPLPFSDLSLIRDRVIFRKPSSSPTTQWNAELKHNISTCYLYLGCWLPSVGILLHLNRPWTTKFSVLLSWLNPTQRATQKLQNTAELFSIIQIVA